MVLEHLSACTPAGTNELRASFKLFSQFQQNVPFCSASAFPKMSLNAVEVADTVNHGYGCISIGVCNESMPAWHNPINL